MDAPVSRLCARLGLDERGWDLGVERLLRSRAWPIDVAQAMRPDGGPILDARLARELKSLDQPVPGLPEAWRLALRGRLFLYKRDGQARPDLLAAIKADPKLEPPRAWLAEHFLSHGELAEARAEAEKLLARRPSCAWALAVRGACARREGKADLAAEDLRKAAGLEPELAWLRVVASETASGALAYAEAVAQAEEAARLAPREAWAHLLLARAIYNCGGERERADRALTAALKLAPELAEARVMSAERLRRQGKFSQALKEYGRVAASGLRYERLHSWRGSLLRQMGRLKEALPDLDLACKLSPESSLGFLERAQARLRLKEFAGAFEDMAAACRLNFTRTWVHERPGEGDDFALVTGLLKEAAEKLPRSPWPRAWLGECHLRRGDAESAIEELDAALAVDPKCAWARAWKGEALLKLGKGAKAAEELAAAAALDPKDARARGRLGTALAGLGKNREALAAFDEAIRLDPRTSWTLGQRGRLQLLLGNPEAAARDLDGALELHRDYADAHLWRCAARRRLKDPRASDDLRRALELRADPAWARRELDLLS
jgi:tetratricopeptide (TPR) repeat protein